MTNEEYKGVPDSTLAVWLKAAAEERDALKVKLDLHNAESAENDWDVATTWWADTRARIRDLGRIHQAIQTEQAVRRKLTAERNHKAMLAKAAFTKECQVRASFGGRLLAAAREMLDPNTFSALVAAANKRTEGEAK